MFGFAPTALFGLPSPRISDQQVSRGMLGDLVDRVFDGSAEAVMLSLFDVCSTPNNGKDPPAPSIY